MPPRSSWCGPSPTPPGRCGSSWRTRPAASARPTGSPAGRWPPASGAGRPAGSTLSDRESTILRLLPSLSTTTEIAEDLHVSPNTIKTQVGAIYSKLGVNDRRAAVVAAYDAGLLAETEEPGRTRMSSVPPTSSGSG